MRPPNDTLRIVAPVTVTTDSLRPVVAVGRPHVDSLAATGGTGSFTWGVVDGTLPAGLQLAAGSGVISGQATTPSEHRVTCVPAPPKFSATRALHYTVLRPPAAVSDSIRPAALPGQIFASPSALRS